MRLILCVLVGVCGIPVLCGLVLRWGKRAVTRLEWNESGDFRLWLASGHCLTARLARCVRLTQGLWILNFETPQGGRRLLVDAGCQQARSVRRLARSLDRRSGGAIQAPARVELLPSGQKV